MTTTLYVTNELFQILNINVCFSIFDQITDFFNKMKHSNKHQRKKFRRLSILGTILIILSGILFYNIQNIFHYVMNKKMIISPNEKYVYDLWTNTPVPISMQVYFFNWTNPEDINNHSIKPRLQEIGPYTFIEHRFKVDIKYHSNGTISYKQQKFWYFDPENSVGSLNDKITSINPIAVVSLFKFIFERHFRVQYFNQILYYFLGLINQPAYYQLKYVLLFIFISILYTATCLQHLNTRGNFILPY